MTMTAEDKRQVVEEHGRGTNDTGSTEVQVALLTARIKHLTEHFASTRRTITPAAGWCAWSTRGASCSTT
jgi:ribosomal protein S15